MVLQLRVVLAALLAAAVLAGTVVAAPAASAEVTYSDPEGRIIKLTNDIRKGVGLNTLKRSEKLSAVAENWARTMAAKYESDLKSDPYASVPLWHNPNTGSQIPSGWYAWGENVAWNLYYDDPVTQLSTQWENSPSHYENIVKSRFKYIGVGYYKDKYGISWGVQVFGDYTSDAAAGVSTKTQSATKAVASDGIETVSLNRGRKYIIKNNLGTGTAHKSFYVGKSSDTVLVGDWDGDGDDTLALKRGNKYYVYLKLGKVGAWRVYSMGKSTDTPLVGDWDGDGDDTISLKRGNRYMITNKLKPNTWSRIFRMGNAEATALVGDFNGNGKDSISLKRGRKYSIKYALDGATKKSFTMGKSKDTALVGDFNGNGKDSISLKRGNKYYIKYKLGPSSSNKIFSIGKASDTPLVGDFDG
ncbi:CAP domain-containing protein [Demequina sp. NBRC 110054]|uniref:CAP domain-containing protein n=1 Tax=Demequina sp. NBRC 110054 TaxID=1570343 RepID=UPI00135643E8|nr:CAP domain-containing protein [Demequina sp. NBRC 110054]